MTRKISLKEVMFMLVLHVLVFLFYSFDRYSPKISIQQILFFLNYAGAALVINYVLLPFFFYRKKYLKFSLGLMVVIAGIILMEELVLERIFYPDTRGKHFPGIIYSLVDVMPVVLILAGFKFGWDALKKQQEVESLKASMHESEMQFLKSQINPHFLFNNLNNLYSYAITNSPKTPEIILELSSVLRYMLYECKEEYVLLSKELEQLENFTRLSELQIEERGNVTFHRPEQDHGLSIAPLILVVFIENAFKHAQATQSDQILIDIDVRVSESGRLEFRCQNSFSLRKNADHIANGIGLSNVKKRLKLLYPGKHQLTIQEEDGFYQVQLIIDLHRISS